MADFGVNVNQTDTPFPRVSRGSEEERPWERGWQKDSCEASNKSPI